MAKVLFPGLAIVAGGHTLIGSLSVKDANRLWPLVTKLDTLPLPDRWDVMLDLVHSAVTRNHAIGAAELADLLSPDELKRCADDIIFNSWPDHFRRKQNGKISTSNESDWRVRTTMETPRFERSHGPSARTPGKT